MSFIADQIRRIDAQLDRAQLAALPRFDPSESDVTAETHAGAESASNLERKNTLGWASVTGPRRLSSRTIALQTAIRNLSPNSSDSRALLRPAQIKTCLSALSEQPEATDGAYAIVDDHEAHTEELAWLLVSKATTQVYGHVLKSILDQAVALSDDLWYWDAVLSSRPSTMIYGVQQSPIQLWQWGLNIFEEAKSRAHNFNLQETDQNTNTSMSQRWARFHTLVRQVVSERNVADLRRHVLGPVTRLRSDIRQKQTNLKKIRTRNANALGVLLGEGLANESVHGNGLISPYVKSSRLRQRELFAHSIALMEAVLVKINDLDSSVDKFDAAVGELTDEDPLITSARYGEDAGLKPEHFAERLSRIMTLALPQYSADTKRIVATDGRPSRLVRYWLPVVVALLSSSTILRILVNRQDKIVHWIEDLGATVLDFWRNWVVEPTLKVVKTIRHDEGSEMSLMSKHSLDADRASLERMVVDFAIDNPANATGSNSALTETQIAEVRNKVREGDLTPVLTAYEKDLTSPLMGTVRGNLVRALLIQVQKTKVDIEIAMGGIDALLKSQELVFGFVGLTPGILVSYFTVQWLRNSFSQKRGSKTARKQGKMLRQLRNIDRIITSSTPTAEGELLYKDQGLLLCEVHVLRQAVEKSMPAEIYKEFNEDAEELCDVRMGVERQKKAADRIRWAYSRYLA